MTCDIASENAIAVRNLSKSYPGFALENVSFTVPRGRIVGCIGENGAGKTTTIDLMLGLRRPDSGELSLLGLDMPQDELEIKKRVAAVPDDCPFPVQLTAKDIGTIYRSIYPAWNETRYAQLLRDFRLPGNKKIQDMSDANWKDRLWSRVRVAVIDIAEDQLAAGINRFRQMEKQPRYAGICSRIIFLKGDVTQPLQADHIGAMEARFGREAVADSLCLGMTSYTVGALDNITLEGGATIAQAMADEMYKQCWKVYAVDFSSPMWRRSAFLKDTGKWGREYLRIVHGCAQKEDELESMPWIVRLYMKIRFGVSLRSVADFVRFMSIGAALASHYTTVWPDSDGHNAGYCVLEDGTLKKPGILSFAERLQGQGATLYYKSKIWLFATLDLGSAGAGNRAWAFIPGWIADFVVAENKSNR